ncbi:MAG: hypothetical protein R3B98_08005, partial [Hyphomonas sp.]
GHKIFDHFEQYERSLRNFARIWAATSNRSDRFWAAYAKTYDRYRALIKLLDRGFLIDNAATIEKFSLAAANVGIPGGDFSGPRKKEKGRNTAVPAPKKTDPKSGSQAA